MLVFDANCAVGPWPTDKPRYETVEGLLAEMERLGIDRALVSHTLARTYDPVQGNQILMDEIAGHEMLLPCWTLLPPACGEMGSLDELLAEMAQAAVRAVRLYPSEHTYSLAEWQCGELFEALAERHYVVLLDLAQGNWGEIERICRTYPRLALIVTLLAILEMIRAGRVVVSQEERFGAIAIEALQTENSETPPEPALDGDATTVA